MKTLDQILAKGSSTLDGRDISRLAQFMTTEQMRAAEINEEYILNPDRPPIKPFTRENVLIQLESDVAFGFEKALNQRGLSAGIMFTVVMMWNWVLEEGLEQYDEENGYAQYGLPLFKDTAVKYGFPNRIGDDAGDESQYACDYED